MPTSMHHFAAIASRFGVDPNDADAVDNFFADTLPTMPVREQEAIVEELLQHEEANPAPADKASWTYRAAQFDEWLEPAAGAATGGLTTDQIMRETRGEE